MGNSVIRFAVGVLSVGFGNENFLRTGSQVKSTDQGLEIQEMITRHGFAVETHSVITEDGYILEMHRIPRHNPAATNNQVVFVMHGLLCSSVNWVDAGPHKALAYYLHNNDYDVWLGNARGNKYSRKHMDWDPDEDVSFWDFSWHEIGKYDLPAMIDYVLNYTGRTDLHYIGHSQGTTSFFVMMSENPRYNDKIKVMVALAPVAFMSNAQNPFFKILARFDKSIETLLPVILSNTPAGAATKQIFHYAQLHSTGKFTHYDHSPWENYKRYRTILPPPYRLDKVQAPVALVYGENDWLAAPKDVKQLYKRLPNVVNFHRVNFDRFNHLDFLWANNVVELVYEPTLKILQNYNDMNDFENKL